MGYDKHRTSTVGFATWDATRKSHQSCSCFRIGLILSCSETGVCEYAAQWVANAINDAVEEAIRK